MHSSSSELLLDQQNQDLLRRKKLLELTARAEKPKPKHQTCQQRIKFYVTSTLALAVSGGFAALLFLVPLYVDPAISTLMSDFDPQPVNCETVQVEYLAGLGNCSWSSCREGCTSDLYKCTHITIAYRPPPENNLTASTQLEATLLVNIKGCGYPPQVSCSQFWNLYSKEGAIFPCYYSRRNASLVMPTYSRAEHIATILHFFLIPFLATTAAGIALCVLHCDCRCSGNTRKRRHVVATHEEDGAPGNKTCGEKQPKMEPLSGGGPDVFVLPDSEASISRIESVSPLADEELTISSSVMLGRPL